MKELSTAIYTKASSIPEIDETNYFHSKRLFNLCRATPRHKPYMVVATTADGQVAGHLLAIVRYRWSWMPPYLYRHCRVLGEGVYADDDVFDALLKALVRRFSNNVLYIEVSHLSRKTTGYRQFRQNGFFGVNWMSIHNSLHSRTPEERIDDRMLRRISSSEKRGVETKVVEGDEEFQAFMKLLKVHNVPKVKRYVPHESFFRGMVEAGDGQLLITRYRERVIGCSALVFSNGNAYLWYMAFRRKTFAFVHPDQMTLWHTIKYCHSQGYQHIYFMDVGLPYKKNSFREFILGFGGKPTSTRRWFRFSIRWVNALLTWLYRD